MSDYLDTSFVLCPYCPLTIGVRQKLESIGFVQDMASFPHNVMLRGFVDGPRSWHVVGVNWHYVVPKCVVECTFTCVYFNETGFRFKTEHIYMFDDLNTFMLAVASYA